MNCATPQPGPADAPLPVQEISLAVLREKYVYGAETTPAAVWRRVAHALAAVEAPTARVHWEERFFAAMAAGFIPAGRIDATAGTDREATLINCFVQPVGDSISQEVDGRPGIYAALKEAAETLRRGGGVGYDFSPIRPRGAWVRGIQALASGPLSYMRVFDASCETVEAAGNRRGAQMAVLRCDHPDIADFVHAKDGGGFANFNFSVGVTDVFMQAVESDATIDLVHHAEPGPAQKAAGAFRRADGLWIYRSVRARELWDQIMASTYDHAEPGALFLDRINRDNNLRCCETIEATNPCAEQPLPAYGCCCLGSVDLTRLVQDPFGARPAFDFAALRELVPPAVRLLDNVLDASAWPLPQQQREARAKRRIGLGFTGLGDALIMLGLRYDRAEGRDFAARVARELRDAAYWASVELARERGPFPLFDAEAYFAEGNFASRLPGELQSAIRRDGLRNSHLLSIAPTGSISLAFADNASNGIEPPYAWQYRRRKRTPEERWQEYAVEDHAFRLFRHLRGEAAPLPAAFVSALEISAADHLAMAAAVAPYIDSSISKTVNVAADYPYEDFRGLYAAAWKAGLKGLATYRPNAVIGQLLSVSLGGRDADPACSECELPASDGGAPACGVDGACA